MIAWCLKRKKTAANEIEINNISCILSFKQYVNMFCVCECIVCAKNTQPNVNLQAN